MNPRERLESGFGDPFAFARRTFQFLTLGTLVLGPFLLWRAPAAPHIPSADGSGGRTDPGDPSRRPLSEYLAAVQKRTVFRNPAAEKPAPAAAAAKPVPAPLPAAPPPPPKPTLAELASDLALVGIVSSGRPQAIFSSRRSQKTFHVTAGEMIGALRVSAITEDRVQLSYNEETLELSL